MYWKSTLMLGYAASKALLISATLAGSEPPPFQASTRMVTLPSPEAPEDPPVQAANDIITEQATAAAIAIRLPERFIAHLTFRFSKLDRYIRRTGGRIVPSENHRNHLDVP